MRVSVADHRHDRSGPPVQFHRADGVGQGCGGRVDGMEEILLATYREEVGVHLAQGVYKRLYVEGGLFAAQKSRRRNGLDSGRRIFEWIGRRAGDPDVGGVSLRRQNVEVLALPLVEYDSHRIDVRSEYRFAGRSRQFVRIELRHDPPSAGGGSSAHDQRDGIDSRPEYRPVLGGQRSCGCREREDREQAFCGFHVCYRFCRVARSKVHEPLDDLAVRWSSGTKGAEATIRSVRR